VGQNELLETSEPNSIGHTILCSLSVTGIAWIRQNGAPPAVGLFLFSVRVSGKELPSMPRKGRSTHEMPFADESPAIHDQDRYADIFIP
jgi:hypothetical protein